MRTTWTTQVRDPNGQWRTVATGRLSTCMRAWREHHDASITGDGSFRWGCDDARLLLNNSPVRMRASDEQLDLYGEDND